MCQNITNSSEVTGNEHKPDIGTCTVDTFLYHDLHILPRGFVKIQHYGIYSSRFRSTILKDKSKMVIKPVETVIEQILRLTGFDMFLCPICKKGVLVSVNVVPRSRSPSVTFSDFFTFRKQ